MAKKKFNIGNLGNPSTSSSNEKSKLTDDAVARIHGSVPSGITKKMGRPRREEAVTRLTVDLPKPIHKKLKMLAMEEEISLRQLVIDILMKEVEK